MTALLRRVAVLGGTRIPFARANGAYNEASNQDMLTAAMAALVERFQLKDKKIGEVAAGAVIKHSRDWNLARESTLGSGLHPETPAYDLQRACGTSLSAVAQLANRISLGEIDCAIAGGADSASDIPLGYGRKLQRAVLKVSRGRSFGEKLSTIGSVRLADLKPAPPSRREQDEVALASHKNAAAAWRAGFFSDLVTEFSGLKTDNNVRGDTSLEKLASLRNAFDPSPAGTLSAGNSSPLTDGAACVLLASEEWASSKGLKPLAYVTFTETAAVDFVGMA